jgi:K+-transporting ATPase ATPase C chain
MFSQLRSAVLLFVILTLVTGVLYPVAVTAIASAVFFEQSTGSPIRRGGEMVGSRWIGQAFEKPEHFWGRLSATAPAYNAAVSSGSNYGPLNPALAEAVKGRIAALRKVDPGNKTAVPIDLVTASASGLDPHISPAAAAYQLPRVARARGISEEKLREIVDRHTSSRTLGILGERRVNVLELNLALDAPESTD